MARRVIKANLIEGKRTAKGGEFNCVPNMRMLGRECNCLISVQQG
jgi:hypothetical protein